jgi:ABC-type lipoprotein export system ATPase subunit
VYVTHDQGLAAQADRVLRMQDGRIEEAYNLHFFLCPGVCEWRILLYNRENTPRNKSRSQA